MDEDDDGTKIISGDRAVMTQDSGSLLNKASGGDRAAFDDLARESLPKLRGVIWRMIGHPEDCEDVMQASLTKAWESIGTFAGRSQFSTWLVAIATRTAIDHLREQKRWRRESQIAYANLCASEEEMQGEIAQTMMEPEFVFDAKEHIAYCFVCIGRSIAPDEQAALVLRDVMDFSNREAANILGISDSVLRHRLAAAREQMEKQYDGLCALISKTGICHQCEGLGLAAVAMGKQRMPLPDIDTFAQRIAQIRAIEPDKRRDKPLHDVFFRRCKSIEEEGRGSTVPDNCD
jgi:RNA polymerase sigma-70 factor (ECF subfamily)